jgi:enoyl-CoA hydratase
VGISQPARWRVATAKTRLAMPETGIGLFPDVGGGWYLSRLQGRLGQYLALTGARLDGAECLWAGLATHYLDEAALAQAKARIAAGESVGAALDALAATPGPAPIAVHAEAIAQHFGHDSLAEILASLARDPAPFAQETLATLNTRAPFSCAVSLRQLATSLALPDFAANMAMEYRIGGRMIVRPDFAEGVRAVIVDKDNSPRWNPASPDGVAPDELDAIFAPLSVNRDGPQQEEWTPL